MGIRFVIALLLGLTGALAQAEPRVIYDAGQGVSTERYLSLFSASQMPEFRDFSQSWLFKEMPAKPATAKDPDLFPIRTRRLTPQRLYQEQESYFALMPYPVCVVGTDALSRAWLKRNLSQLVAMDAQCLLVAAETAEEARDLLSLAQGLMVYPANGDAIAEYFKIQHYPVLITDRYVTQ
jgi:integrating conjugative element protein (TIGR03765 family)